MDIRAFALVVAYALLTLVAGIRIIELFDVVKRSAFVRVLRVAGIIVQFYTLRAQTLVKDRYRELSSRDLFAPICRDYEGLGVWGGCKHPEGC